MNRSLFVRGLALSAALSLAAAACTRGPEPHDAGAAVAPVAAAVDAAVDAGPVFLEIRVKRGETFWDIAHRYGVELRDLRAFNHLTQYQAKHIREGQVLRVPGVEEEIDEDDDEDDAGIDAALVVGDAETAPADAGVADGSTEAPAPVAGASHVLAEGETLWDVARTYDTTVDEILRANQWDDDDARGLRPGAQVVVPGVSERRVRAEMAKRARHVPHYGTRHRIEAGESVWTLANRYHVSVSEIMAANGLTPRDAENLPPGRSILLPGVTAEAHGRLVAPRRLTPAQQRALQVARRLGLGNRNAAGALLHGHVSPRWITAAGGSRNRLPGTLRWPVANGRFVRGFGSGQGGYHRAVDIAGDIGWNVRAAAPGIVGYSGDELSGFGNVVLVVHPGGWVTLYGHNSVNFVVAGQRVRAGTILAEVGSTGRSMGPHVHFELMFDGRNCDPAALFRPGVRHAHRLARIEKLTWTSPRDRPDDVDCLPRMRHPTSDLVVNE